MGLFNLVKDLVDIVITPVEIVVKPIAKVARFTKDEIANKEDDNGK